jgi:hypothetical protein
MARKRRFKGQSQICSLHIEQHSRGGLGHHSVEVVELAVSLLDNLLGGFQSGKHFNCRQHDTQLRRQTGSSRALGTGNSDQNNGDPVGARANCAALPMHSSQAAGHPHPSPHTSSIFGRKKDHRIIKTLDFGQEPRRSDPPLLFAFWCDSRDP